MAIRYVSLFLCLFASWLSAVRSEDVVALTPDTFDNEVGKERGALVEFYAPWCGHCKKLAPEYEKLGTNFKRAKSVLIAKVDCDEHKSLCSKYGVSGFPTIKWFPKGSLEPTDYKGGRTTEELAEFVNNEGGTNVKIAATPSDVVVLTPENFDSIVLDETKDVLVEFYAPWCGHCKQLAPTYEKVASTFKLDKDVVIANCDADKYRDISEKYGVSGFPTLKFFPKTNKAGEDYDEGRDLDAFVEFINKKAGTNRDRDGKLNSEAGKVSSLDELVKEFLKAAENERASILAKLEEESGKLSGRAESYGKIYVKSAKKVLEKGADYAKNEVARLHRILEKSVNPAKADEFVLRKNVLSSFVATQ